MPLNSQMDEVNFEEIDAVGTELAEILIDPRMDTGMLRVF